MRHHGLRLQLALPLGIVVWLTCTAASSAQLSITSAAFNPLAGQGVPPDGISIQKYPVNLYVGTTNLVSVSESDYTFTVNMYILMHYNDSRTQPIILSNYSSCTFFCSSRGANVQNAYGEPACCDGVYIPQAYIMNGVEFLEQTFPYRYVVAAHPGGEVEYYTQLQATLSASFDYSSYPFDTHFLTIDITTDYLPTLRTDILTGAGFSASDGILMESQFQSTGDPVFQPGAYRPALTSVDCAGWVLHEAWLDVMHWTLHNSNSPHAHHTEQAHGGPMLSENGVRVYLRIVRASRAFYFVILILPTALIVFFSFVIFGFPMTSQKARINLIVTLFLTLIILQFTLQQFLPGTFTMISPVYLVLLSYIYTFLLLVVSVFSAILLNQYSRREKAAVRKQTRNDYQKFRAALLSGDQLLTTKEDIHHQSALRIRQLLESQALNPSYGTQGQDRQLKSASDAPSSKPSETVQMPEKPQDPAAIDDAIWTWYEAQMQHWYFRKLPPLRTFLLWYKFIGQSSSQNYLDFVCHRTEVFARRILFSGYVAAAAIIFGYAATREDPNSILHTEDTS